MGTGMAGNALHLPSRINQITNYGILTINIPKLTILIQGSGQGHTRGKGNQPGNTVNITVGHSQRPSHIPEGSPSPQCAKGDNLSHMVWPIFLGYIANNLITTLILKV